MGVKRDILAILTDQEIYDSLGIKNHLVSRDKRYRYLTLNNITAYLRRLEKDGDIKIKTVTRANWKGQALPGRKIVRCQITRHGLKKVEYLYKHYKIRKEMITALG